MPSMKPSAHRCFDVAVVKLVNLQNADEKLAEALVTYTKQAAKDPNGSSVVICQHEGGQRRSSTNW